MTVLASKGQTRESVSIRFVIESRPQCRFNLRISNSTKRAS